MKTADMKLEIEKLAAAMPASKIDSCLGDSLQSINRSVAARRFCGLAEGAAEFECNVCGETHPVGQAHAIARGGCPCLACDTCYGEYEAL